MSSSFTFDNAFLANSRLKEWPILLLENIANPLLWSLLVRTYVADVTHRIRKYVLGDAQEALKLKESYKDNLALQAVSSAIVAQIAITMLSLSDLGNIHWIATAFIYTSLILGLLSTYFSFWVQQILSELHNPEEVQAWLSSPRNKPSDKVRSWLEPHLPRFINEDISFTRERIPSLSAAAALTAPTTLLSSSIVALFVALGIYLGSMYTADLGDLKGGDGNFGILLFFILVTTWSIVEIYLPLTGKDMEIVISSLRLYRSSRGGVQAQEVVRNDDSVSQQPNAEPVALPSLLREALQASIRAQEESLRAQNALLRLLDSETPPGHNSE